MICKKKFFIFFYIIVNIILSISNSWGEDGSCACKKYRKPLTTGKSFLNVRVLRDNTPLFKDSKTKKTDKYLSFDQQFKVMTYKNERIQIRRSEDTNLYGWVDAKDLLCAEKPLRSSGKNETGLEKKFFIKTANKIRMKKPETITAYPSPFKDNCKHGRCRKLGRFEGYFVFHEIDDWCLLSENYRLLPDSKLLGWVKNKDGFIWDTSLGLRPKEYLKYEAGQRNGQEKPVYAYLSKEDAINQNNGRPILGGDRWYTCPIRIPLLEVVNIQNRSFYKVVIPLPGQAGELDPLNDIFSIKSKNKLPQTIEKINDIKKIDIFFLIDGTNSIQKYFSRIGDVVKKLSNKIQKNIYKDIRIRYGFGIYRDKYAMEEEFSDWCSSTDKKKFLLKFEQTLKKISYLTKDQRKLENNDLDYEENVYGAFEKYFQKELTSEPDNSKILFLIGDHGYSEENQKRLYKRIPVKQDKIIKILAGSRAEGTSPVITYIIQTPLNPVPSTKFTKDQYHSAYRSFMKQGEQILNGIKEKSKYMQKYHNKILNNDKYLFQLKQEKDDDVTLSNLISENLGKIINPETVEVFNQIKVDLNGGESLVSIIERYTEDKRFKNIPGLFWDVLENKGCKHLGRQCSEQLMDTILEGYIPKTDDIVIDVWFPIENLQAYIDFTGDIGKLQLHSSTTKIRIELSHYIVGSLENFMPVDRFKTGETLGTYYKRYKGLPIRMDSPIFDLKVKVKKDESNKEKLDLEVTDKQIERLIAWIGGVNKLLNIVLENKRPKYELMYNNSTKIPKFVGEISKVNFKRKDMSYSYNVGNTIIYWVPMEFLP